MANKNVAMYKLKKTISMKKFISEFGEDFTAHTKERLLELEIRTVLTRSEYPNILDIKHVEHTKYECCGEAESRELTFGRLIVNGGKLYFTGSETDSNTLMEAENVPDLYNSLKADEKIVDNGISAKEINEDNIDFFMDKMLDTIPEVSESYIKIIKEMLAYDKK